MITVAGGPGTISILCTDENPNDTYQVAVSGGPTAVSGFGITLDSNGDGSATIPPNGTTSALQAGTYTVKITKGKQVETFQVTVTAPGDG
jgi:hypothetical protein